MLTKGIIATPLEKFILRLNEVEQRDKEKVIKEFCFELETIILDAMRNITITLPPGTIQVQGSAAAQTNIVPIIINKSVK
jgi:hypothetical protein